MAYLHVLLGQFSLTLTLFAPLSLYAEFNLKHNINNTQPIILLSTLIVLSRTTPLLSARPATILFPGQDEEELPAKTSKKIKFAKAEGEEGEDTTGDAAVERGSEHIHSYDIYVPMPHYGPVPGEQTHADEDDIYAAISHHDTVSNKQIETHHTPRQRDPPSSLRASSYPLIETTRGHHDAACSTTLDTANSSFLMQPHENGDASFGDQSRAEQEADRDFPTANATTTSASFDNGSIPS